MIFHSKPFPGKTNDKIFWKMRKAPPFLGILGSFLPKYGRIEIFQKNRLCQFLDIIITWKHARNHKKLITQFCDNALVTVDRA